MQVLVPMAGLIDKDAELARTDKEIARTGRRGQARRRQAVQRRLRRQGAGRGDRQERAKLAEAEQAKAKLQEQRDRIATL